MAEVQTYEACCRKDECGVWTIFCVEFGEPGADVAADGLEFQVRVEAGELGGAAYRGGADDGVGGEGAQGGVCGEFGGEDHGVAGVFAGEDCAKVAGGGELGGHILCVLC